MAEKFLGLERLKYLLQNLKRALNMTGSTIQNVTLENPTATGTITGWISEGTEIKSTGEAGGSKFLREDGDGTCSWQTVSTGSGAVATVANGADNRVATFSSSDALNGEANLTFDGTDLGVSAKIFHIGDTDTYINFTDDDINIQCGGVNFLDFTEDTQNDVTFNEGGVDIDFRIESADESHMFFMEASSNRISIGDNTGSPGATLEVKNNASAGATGVPLVQLNSNDTDQQCLDINAGNITANVVNITANDVTTARVLAIGADGLTTGNALYVDDNSSDTGTRKTALIIQNDAAAIAATALAVQSDGGVTGVKIDKNYSDTAEASITGLFIDWDKTGASTSDNTMYGIQVDMDNTTATNGNNYMYGLHVTPTLTHAADAGGSFVYGALINAQGGTNGSSLVQGARIEAGGGDVNYGIQLDVEDGGVDLRIESSADSGDYFQIQTTTHGATTISTVDDNAAAANLQITADGTVDIDSAGALTLDSGAAINIEPAAGSAILLDGTISVDAGVITGATSITSTNFVGIIGASGAAAGTFTTLNSNGATTLGDAAGDVITVTGQLTASRGLVVADDMKLRFGNATGGDATIEYDEDGTDQLRFAGASVIFGQDVTGSKGISMPDDTKLRFGNATGGDAHVRYAETGNDHLIISGSSTGLVLSGSQIVISGDKQAHWQRHTVQVTGAMNIQYLTGSKGMMIPDDQKLRFGSATGGDATIEYDENGTDQLRFAGAAVIFGQDITGSKGISIPDDVKLRFGSSTGGDVTLKYDESSTDTLFIEGGNVAVADDKKLYFGTGKDSFVEYNEDGDDFLIVSGSAKGIALSGTLVNVDGSVRGRMLHYTYHNYYYTSTAKHYIPINSTIETTDIETEYNHWLAPHNGKLVKIIVNADGDHAGSGTPPGSTEIGLHLDRNATAATTVTENLTIASAGVGDNITFEFTSNNTFTAGQFIAISVDAAARLYDMRMTCVWEYDTTT